MDFVDIIFNGHQSSRLDLSIIHNLFRYPFNYIVLIFVINSKTITVK